MRPKISIIIPVFNSEKFLAATLDSLKSQLFLSWECILVDDGSSDDSLAIAARYAEGDPRFRSFKRPEKRFKGASSCRNFGKSMASGKYIQFFDSDDLMHPDHLSKKMAALEDTNADVVVCRLREVFIGEGKVRINDVEAQTMPADLVSGKANWYVCGPIWSAARIDGVEFPENISNLDDLVFNLRALRMIQKVIYIKDPLIDYIRHEQGITGAFSKADPVEIDSTIRAKQLICRELKESGQYDAATAKSQVNSIVHLGYLASISRRLPLMGRFLRLLLESGSLASASATINLLAACILWIVSGKGYALVGKLKS